MSIFLCVCLSACVLHGDDLYFCICIHHVYICYTSVHVSVRQTTQVLYESMVVMFLMTQMPPTPKIELDDTKEKKEKKKKIYGAALVPSFEALVLFKEQIASSKNVLSVNACVSERRGREYMCSKYMVYIHPLRCKYSWHVEWALGNEEKQRES